MEKCQEFVQVCAKAIRDWSLITGRGGGDYKTGGGGGHVKFYPYEKGGGGGKSFSHAEGGGTKSFGVVFTW